MGAGRSRVAVDGEDAGEAERRALLRRRRDKKVGDPLLGRGFARAIHPGLHSASHNALKALSTSFGADLRQSSNPSSAGR